MDHNLSPDLINLGRQGWPVLAMPPACGPRLRLGGCHSDHTALLVDDEIKVFEAGDRSGGVVDMRATANPPGHVKALRWKGSSF